MKGMKTILLVEDDRVDAMTVKRALKAIHVNNPLVVMGNGEEGLAWLHDGGNDLPCIILLDLNMPRMNGIEFLDAIKKEDRLRTIPVVILTTSKDELDRARSFDLGVAGYMVKPVDYVQFVDVIRTINLYWTLSELPV
ncbi:response regulator [Candidatus Magnetaquicoccus inordinatus]|uniref:response regulator n=1 Tax=Candidatus Magnetaquicoccus inordinatus TaxID=2496818 RepID=UPI00102D05F0|nr:response regulator [Candidatus Magnetaquicoccus inordinatus]